MNFISRATFAPCENIEDSTQLLVVQFSYIHMTPEFSLFSLVSRRGLGYPTIWTCSTPHI